MGYHLEGQILEVCTCNVLCPCWVGEDPDHGTCDGLIAYHIDRGTIDGVDVSGLTLAVLAHIPGNILKGNWRVAVVVDDRATPQQRDALLKAWTGQLGGPLADIAGLIGEVVAVEQAPISFNVQEGKGTLRVGTVAEAEMVPYVGPHGQVTTLNESIFSTTPGSPAWVGKAPKYRLQGRQYGLKNIDLQDHNSIQGVFRFEA